MYVKGMQQVHKLRVYATQGVTLRHGVRWTLRDALRYGAAQGAPHASFRTVTSSETSEITLNSQYEFCFLGPVDNTLRLQGKVFRS